jgi:hypothetical protein
MSEEMPLSVDGLLSELKASLSQPSGEAALRRINAERLLRLLAEEFMESHQAERIRILTDNRLVGVAEADLLFQIDDYDIRLQLLDAPENTPVLNVDQLPDLLRLLENNPSTVALILVWTTDDLVSVPMSVARIRYLIENPGRLPGFISSAQPLPDVLRDVVARQVKVWEAGLGTLPRPETAPVDSRQLFEEAFGKAIERERRRSYRVLARKEAAQHFPVQKEKQVIMAAFKEAVSGASAKILKQRLSRLPRRGGS